MVQTLLRNHNHTMKENRSFAVLISFVILAIGAAMACARFRFGANAEAIGIGIGTVVLALIVSSTIQVADQWDRAVILRLGHFHPLPKKPMEDSIHAKEISNRI